MRAAYKWLLKWARTLHIYLSMFALLALFFFAATGFMLNHPDWFDIVRPRPAVTRTSELPADLISEPLDAYQQRTAERVRAAAGVEGEVESFEIGKEQLRVAFQTTDGRLTLRVDRGTGRITAADDDGEATRGELPPDVIAAPLDSYQLRIVERLRVDPHYAVTGLVDSFEIEPDVLRIAFRAPGRATDVAIDRETGAVEAKTESRGVPGLLTDLHKGTNAGGPWGFVIDGVSILLLFISATGLLLWISLKKRLAIGFVSLLTGTAAVVAVYYLYVP
jgi:hypothetical protein